MPELTPDVALAWIERWERQQEESLPDREERFTALIDAVALGSGRDDPVVIDLGCGPGSLSVRLLDRLPRATVVAVDTDPVTLALGRAAYGDRPGLRFVDLDLRTTGWSSRLGLEAGRPVDRGRRRGHRGPAGRPLDAGRRRRLRDPGAERRHAAGRRA